MTNTPPKDKSNKDKIKTQSANTSKKVKEAAKTASKTIEKTKEGIIGFSHFD